MKSMDWTGFEKTLRLTRLGSKTGVRKGQRSRMKEHRKSVGPVLRTDEGGRKSNGKKD